MKTTAYSISVLLLVLLLAACGERSEAPSVRAGDTPTLVVYSSRSEHLILPIFEKFTAETGIAIDYATDKAGVLIERLKAEGERTPADVLITVDAGTLGYAAAQGLFQPYQSALITQQVPAYLRDEQGYWTGLSQRARTVVYSSERVAADALSSYRALGDTQWHGRLCLRTAKKVYNQSLVAMLIAEHGEAAAEKIVSAWVENLAIAPTSNDTQVMKAILAGQCDVGIVNSYYFGRLQAEQPDLPLALHWPNQSSDDSSGVHVNVAGAGILKHSPHPEQANIFLDWLLSDTAQSMFAALNREYPVVSHVAVDPQVAGWGEFRASALPLSRAYALQPAAVKLMDRAGYR